MPTRKTTKASTTNPSPAENTTAPLSTPDKERDAPLNHEEIVDDVIREALHIMKTADKDENKIKAMQLILRHVRPDGDKITLPPLPHIDWEAE